jgi:hypothetical protein
VKKFEMQQNKGGRPDLTTRRAAEEPKRRASRGGHQMWHRWLGSPPLSLPHLPFLQSPSPATREGGEGLLASDLAEPQLGRRGGGGTATGRTGGEDDRRGARSGDQRRRRTEGETGSRRGEAEEARGAADLRRRRRRG